MESVEKRATEFRKDFDALHTEIAKMIVGHKNIIEGTLTAVLMGGHVLLEGVPGLGKTLLVKTLSQALDCKFNRIQFTPDLMPSDVIGTDIVVETDKGHREFRFQQGPLFTQIALADEINRATPKTQSALLEAMQEHQVTVSGKTYVMEEPFFVLATQNPLEMEGTYPLPEAQLDRFVFKLLVEVSSREELSEVLTRTTEGHEAEINPVLTGERILEMRSLVNEVPVADHVKDYAVRLVLGSHPDGEYASEMVNRYVRYGSSPRGAQALVLGGKVRALLDGRYAVAFEDIDAVALPALRHRMILNFEGEAEGISTDDVVKDILKQTPQVLEKA